MDQFSIAQHIHWSQNNPDLPVVQLKWNPRAVKPYCPIWKALPWDIKSSLTSSQTTRWIQKQPPSTGWARTHLAWGYQSAAVECLTPCPGAVTVPLHTTFPQFITAIRLCQLLLMLALHLPMKVYWLTEGVRRIRITQTSPVFVDVFKVQ